MVSRPGPGSSETYQRASRTGALRCVSPHRTSLACLAPQSFYKLLLVSSHYNTQLGLLSALGVDRQPAAAAAVPWLARIPSLAALLALELHRDPGSSAWAVRLVAQVGARSTASTAGSPTHPPTPPKR
jgi:hypothetical protein